MFVQGGLSLNLLISLLGLSASFYISFNYLIPMGNGWLSILAASLPFAVLMEAFGAADDASGARKYFTRRKRR